MTTTKVFTATRIAQVLMQGALAFGVTAASAAVVFGTGHLGGNGIHLQPGAEGVLEITTAHLHPAGPPPNIHFGNAANATTSPLYLHASPGVAKISVCDAASPCSTNSDFTAFRTIDIWLQPGWAFDHLDWELSIDNNQGSGLVNFTAYDQFGASWSAGNDLTGDQLTLSSSDKRWHFSTTGDTLVTRMTFSSAVDVKHLEQMAAHVSRINGVPEPSSLVLAALALLAVPVAARRRAP